MQSCAAAFASRVMPSLLLGEGQRACAYFDHHRSTPRLAMTTSVNNLSSNKLGGLPGLKDSGSIKEPTLQRSESRKSLSGPDGLQANSQSKGELGGSLAPRSNINLLRKNSLIQAQKRELNAETVRDSLIKSRDGKNSDDGKASLLNDLHSSRLFQHMQRTNSGNEDAVISIAPPGNDDAPRQEPAATSPSAPPVPPPPPPLPTPPPSPKEPLSPPAGLEVYPPLDLDENPPEMYPPINHENEGGQIYPLPTHMDAGPPSGTDYNSEPEMDVDVDVHAHVDLGSGHHGIEEELKPDEKTQRLIRMQEQQEANANALTELNVRIQEQAAIRDVIAKMAEANRKTVEAAAKAMVDAAPK